MVEMVKAPVVVSSRVVAVLVVVSSTVVVDLVVSSPVVLNSVYGVVDVGSELVEVWTVGTLLPS